jgi:hypothetical protein
MTEDEKFQVLTGQYKAIFKSDDGADVFADLKRHCHEGQNPYVKNSFDGTAYNCGVLSVIQYINHMLVSDGTKQTETITERTEL